jgi:protein STE50
MLKHIKDIRSPIAVAQQKHAARKATSSEASTSHGRTHPANNSTRSRPPKLEVSETTTPGVTGPNPQPPWLEVMSPSVENKDNELGSATPTVPNSSGSVDGTVQKANDSREENSRSQGREALRDIPVALSGVSYAVAIYPSMAEQDDEFDVVV